MPGGVYAPVVADVDLERARVELGERFKLFIGSPNILRRCRVCWWLAGRVLDTWHPLDRRFMPPVHPRCKCRLAPAEWDELTPAQRLAWITGTLGPSQWDDAPAFVREGWGYNARRPAGPLPQPD